MRTTEDLIRRSLVRTVRANNALHSQLPGGEHEGVAPRGARYPFLTYDLVTAVYDDDWSDRMIRSLWDIWIVSEDQVEASTLDSLTMTTLEDSLQPVTLVPEGGTVPVEQQIVLYCRRVAGLRDKEVTDEDKTIYRVGGSYSIWTNQPLQHTDYVAGMTDTVTGTG